MSEKNLLGDQKFGLPPEISDQRIVQLAETIAENKSITSSPSTSLNIRTNMKNIGYSAAFIIASVTEDAIDQLHIIGAGLVPKTKFFFGNIKDRAKDYISDDPIFDPETGDPFEVSLEKKKFMKLYVDSSKITEILVEIRNEMRNEKDFTCLTKFLEDMRASKIDELNLCDEEMRNLDSMIQLKQTLQSAQRDSQNYMRAMNEEIAVLKDQAEDVLFENLIRTRYISNWEESRNEQNQLTCFQKESELENTISKYKNEIEKEMRVNSEIELYITENQKDMEDDIEAWMERYDNESESRTLEIQVLKEKREDLEIENTALQEVYDSHQVQIDDFLLYKENKRIEEERIAFLSIRAIKIQAWWRGLMVRKQLGPFNPRKAKKAAAKEKKQKGKKKK